MGLPGAFERFGVDERMKCGGNDFNCVESGGTQIVGNPAGGAFDVRFVLGLGADAGDAKKFVQFGKVLVTA